MRAALLSIAGLVCCAPTPPDAPSSTTSIYSPPALAPAPAERALPQPVLVAPSASTTRPLRRVTFKAAPTLRQGALEVLTATQLDELDRAYLGRLDLNAFVAEQSTVFVWLDGDLVEGADVALKDGRRMRVGRYQGSAGSPAGWYDQDGLSLTSEILGRPLQLSRVTSKFGERLHPFSGAIKQHRGIDYGAPEGTPVFAVGDGTIETLATDKAAGNHLKLSHRSDYESWYLHLHHFAQGLVKGAQVHQGDIIGYVGTTGASTGPHLHYELHRNGLALDPQRKLSLPVTALGPLSQPQHRKMLEAFP